MTPDPHARRAAAAADAASSTAPRVLAFDIGGTWVKYGVVDAAGRLLFVDQLATRGEADGPALLARLIALAQPLVALHRPAGVAFSTLGIIASSRK